MNEHLEQLKKNNTENSPPPEGRHFPTDLS